MIRLRSTAHYPSFRNAGLRGPFYILGQVRCFGGQVRRSRFTGEGG